MKHGFLLLTCLLALNGIAQKRKAAALPKDPLASLDTAFARVLTDWKAAGFAVAVIEKNNVIYAAGFGHADYAQKRPVTPNTVFSIGSCTKAFTSSLMGLLQKDGKLTFDKSVATYLPGLVIGKPDISGQITLRDAMCHRTGFPRNDYSWVLNSPGTRDSLLQRMAHFPVSAPLRQRWQYNNWMFLLQGAVAEKLTGTRWEDNVKTRLFAPLGMKSSFFNTADVPKQPDYALGYGLRRDSLIYQLDPSDVDAIGPAGSIKSTVNDMAQWVRLWINGGKLNGREVLPATYVNEAISSQMVIGAGLPTKEIPDAHLSNYGFGWFLSSYKGHYRVEHGGNVAGFSASTCFFPTDSVGIVVLTNQNSSQIPTIVRNIIADRLLGKPYFDWNGDRLKANRKAQREAREAEKKALSNRKPNTRPSHPMPDYAGLYTHEGYGTFVVDWQRDSLFVKTRSTTAWLAHYHYDIFRDFGTRYGIDTTQRGATRYQFTTGLNGDIDGLLISGMETSYDEPLRFVRTQPAKPLTAAELTAYVGDYTLSGITVKTYLKAEKTLVLVVPGQPEYDLVPVGNHTFNFASPAGYSVVFEMGAGNVPRQMTIRQPNGNFIAERK
jgi:CubicO group peptidase (beta-lactamase class C family)